MFELASECKREIQWALGDVEREISWLKEAGKESEVGMAEFVRSKLKETLKALE